VISEPEALVMDSITDAPPPAIAAELQAARAALDQQIPAKAAANLLIATWNLRAFGSLTRKWTAAPEDSPKRDLRGLRAIIEIVQRFDVIAVQEVKGDLRALRDLVRYLGDDWGFLMTDVTRGSAGNDERLAFLFDRRRLRPSGLAAEVVVPPEWISGEQPDAALRRQFVRTPYAVSFVTASGATFILLTAHIDFGSAATERVPELAGIAQWMASWAAQTYRWHHNLLVLGDFNVDRRGSPLWQAFTSTGLVVPEVLHTVPRTLFSDPAAADTDKFYDQIAWFEGARDALIDLTFASAGGFDFLPFFYRDAGLSKTSISWRISDHYPLWVEFRC
jgi:endonuclease/exonuclease/phosphatase family metal-dependent hydrolase